MKTKQSSQLEKFYKRSVEERQKLIREWIESENIEFSSSLTITEAEHMVENVIGVYGLPMGIATNFLINGKDYLIPMVIEEPSVIAAASNAAKMFRSGGGFTTSSDRPVMIGQIQLVDIPDIETALSNIHNAETILLEKANNVAGSIVKRGGGAESIKARVVESSLGLMLIVHLLMDVQDAMGANIINTCVEHISEDLAILSGGRANLRILSNLSDQRKARAEGIVPAHILGKGETGHDAVAAIVEAGIFAEVDPYRATTHNKGIMNGIDAVVIATGNDWRAIEAGAHAFAARDGSYTSLTQWRQTASGDLHGSIELPMAVGIVGGATRVHPTAQIAMRILGVESARELAEVIAAVGLAQNFAAIRALATEGIQKGHMRLHAKQLAVAAGATPEQVQTVVEQLIGEQNIRLERAKNLVRELREQQGATE